MIRLWQRYLQKTLRYGLWHLFNVRKLFTRKKAHQNNEKDLLVCNSNSHRNTNRHVFGILSPIRRRFKTIDGIKINSKWLTNYWKSICNNYNCRMGRLSVYLLL